MDYIRHTTINGHTVALPSKTASSALVVYAAAHADPPATINGFLVKDDMERALALRRFWHKHCPEAKDLSAVFLLVRRPLERIAGWISQFNLNTDAVIDNLESGGDLSRDKHALPLSNYFGISTTLFRYDEHMSEFLAVIGVKSLPRVNTRPEHVEFSASQTARLEYIYSPDIILYESTAEAGQPLIQ